MSGKYDYAYLILTRVWKCRISGALCNMDGECEYCGFAKKYEEELENYERECRERKSLG